MFFSFSSLLKFKGGFFLFAKLSKVPLLFELVCEYCWFLQLLNLVALHLWIFFKVLKIFSSITQLFLYTDSKTLLTNSSSPSLRSQLWEAPRVEGLGRVGLTLCCWIATISNSVVLILKVSSYFKFYLNSIFFFFLWYNSLTVCSLALAACPQEKKKNQQRAIHQQILRFFFFKSSSPYIRQNFSRI